MLKLLTMETARAGMRTIAMSQYDEKNCFDRIFRQNSNIFAQKAGVSKNILTARTLVKDNMKRRVKTGTHHTLKVLPPDAVLVSVERKTDHTQITGVIPNPTHTWRDTQYLLRWNNYYSNETYGTSNRQ